VGERRHDAQALGVLGAALKGPIDGSSIHRYSPKMSGTLSNGKIKTLYSAEQISARVHELGQQIARDYRDRSLVILSILKGSFVFTADLMRAIDLPLRVEFLGVQSYGDDTQSSGVVQITLDLARPIDGEHVLIVEDIVDTGLTLDYIRGQIDARRAASVKVCSLLHKPARMKKRVEIDYLGFTIDDVFVVGYGLDWAQKYRNLPMIGVVQDER
jgi:hypoxanthine phosphoribosyltransferase